MLTSSFFHYDGPGRISIARKVPRGTPAGYRIYKPLWPGSWLWEEPYKSDIEAYRNRYFRDVLGPLNPQQVHDELHTLSGGFEPVLLCWEHLVKPDDWCHRRMVAEWFESELGIDVPERGPAPKKNAPKKQPTLFEAGPS